MRPYQEFFQSTALPRPHFETLAKFLAAHKREDAEAVRRAVLARLREQEVTYNILGAPDGTPRNWVLDEVPHVIPEAEFASLAPGIAERAQLLEACLLDFYGPQHLVRNGVVPPQLVLGNPHFFRSLHGFSPVGVHRLTLYAADLVKGPDGGYLVHSDRTAAPAGAGYALENRLAIGQILSQPFVDCRIRKLNRYFDVMRQTMQGLSPRNSGNPRIVLLTPGVFDQSSFEHGYLARYLGFELVEGRDLTVRGEDVFLKTLEGLKPVDVILRRISDDWCDPLELREDSMLGVSGLAGAARAGTVGIANPLGSGLVESPALRAYLPRIAQALGLPPLKVPSIPTRYLGDAAQREEVLDALDSWIIRPAFDDRREEARPSAALSQAEKEQLRKRVLEAPDLYAAEQWPIASIVPVGLELGYQGSLSLRLFACRSGDQFLVMPGGLGRVDGTPDGLFLYEGQPVTGKDVWVMGSETAREPALPRMPQPPMEIRRGGIDLPSRLFDDIFWLGRYLARANDSARLIRSGLLSLQAEDREVPPEIAQLLLRSLVSQQALSPALAKSGDFSPALLQGVYHPNQANSIRSCLARVHRLTTATRSRLSIHTWTTLRRLTALFDFPSEMNFTPQETMDLLDELLLTVAAFHGFSESNMVRGQAWVFLEMGRRLEQGVFVFTLLTHAFTQGPSRPSMHALLRICDSLLTYRSRYLSDLQATPVVDLVLTDDTNPQSVLFQVRRLLSCVRSLPQKTVFPLSRAEQRLIGLETSLVTADVARACRGDAADLRELAEEGITFLWQVSDDLSQTYFAHATRSHSVSVSHWIDSQLEADL